MKENQTYATIIEREDLDNTLMRYAPIPVFLINPDTSIVYVNEAFENLTGFLREEIVGTRAPYPWWIGEPESALARLRWQMQKGSYRYERQFQRKNGERFWVDLSTTLISHFENKYHFSCWVDITDRKRIEEELHKYQDHLEELVETRTRELMIVNKRLKREISERRRVARKLKELYRAEKRSRNELELQSKRRIEFTRGLVHEIKTPLTALIAASDMLVEHVQGEPYVTLVRNIQLGTLNLNKRIDELTDLTRGEVGILRLNLGPVDLLSLVREVAEYVYPEINAQQKSLILNLPATLPTITADEDRLRQVLLNLLDNAIKFTPDKGEITLRIWEESNEIAVAIKDTGCGISKRKQKRLFTPYYQQEHDKGQFSGLGLGLALCRTLINLHGGKIEADSSLDEGSTFTFYLPV